MSDELLFLTVIKRLFFNVAKCHINVDIHVSLNINSYRSMLKTTQQSCIQKFIQTAILGFDVNSAYCNKNIAKT